MNINLICSKCFKPLDNSIKYDKLQGVIIEVNICKNCIQEKELIDNVHFQEDENWKKITHFL